MMPVQILGLGTAVPPHRLDQSEAARFASLLAAHGEEQARRVAILYRRAGVRGRHMVVLDHPPQGGESPDALQSLFPEANPDDASSGLGPTTSDRMAYYASRAAPLAECAARAALGAADLSPQVVTHLVTVSCTGFTAPGVDVSLIERLRLCATVERVHVGFMGCQGALNALRVARALAQGSPSARVLLCAVELCGLHFQYSTEPDAIVANSLFADGAAAAVIGASHGSDPQNGWCLRANGAGLIPDSLDAMTWTIGNHGFAMTLSARVPSLIETHLAPWMQSWLRQHQLTVDDIGSWAIHPGGTRILSAAEKALGLSPDTGAIARNVLASYGNMSSPTVLFVLKELMAAGAPRPCVALAFGPGLSVEAALFT